MHGLFKIYRADKRSHNQSIYIETHRDRIIEYPDGLILLELKPSEVTQIHEFVKKEEAD